MSPTPARIFEEEARDLLALSGNAIGELQLEHKKIDLLLEQERFAQRIKVAVECKAFKRQLSMSDVSKIRAEYQPLLETRAVDEVLIISRAGVAPSANALIRNARGFAHLTLEELANDVLDLASYMTSLREQYIDAADGLSRYFVPPRTDRGADLLTVVETWIEASDRPMAILGAYGTGKSSFARHLAAHLASGALEDPAARRPILIRLSDISAEQSLEGLLGRTLGVTVAVPNYSFDRFIALNRRGRFVVILDGFDEMKRTLSWEQFRYNFAELNRLVDREESRVLILGRPTVLLNDDEYDLALRGREKVAQREIRLPGLPEYKTHSLELFTPTQVQEFLEGYLRYVSSLGQQVTPRAAHDGGEVRDVEIQIRYLMSKVTTGHLREIARRPVQLKMLVEVLPSWDDDLDKLNTTNLFDHFINRIIEREAAKLTRDRFSTKERRRFATELAWWLWNTSSRTTVTADQIPDDMIDRYAGPGESRDGIRRDLVAACFLDRARGAALTFPHRSFQEYLVAGHLQKQMVNRTISINSADSSANQEIVDFLCEMLDTDDLARFSETLNEYRGPMSYGFARLWFSDSPKVRWLTEQRRGRSTSPWFILLSTHAAMRGALAHDERATLTTELLEDLEGDVEAPLALLIWRCLLQLGATRLDDAIIERATAELVRDRGRDFDSDGLIADVLRRLRFRSDRQGLDVGHTYTRLEGILQGYCWIGERRRTDTLPVRPVRVHGTELEDMVRQFVAAS